MTKGLRALTTSKERQELRAIDPAKLEKAFFSFPKAPTINRKGLVLRYKGQMLWAKQYGIDARLWDVISPVLPTYDYSSGGYPTFTLEGLKSRGLIS